MDGDIGSVGGGGADWSSGAEEETPARVDGGYQPLPGSDATWGPSPSDFPAPSAGGVMQDLAQRAGQGIGNAIGSGASWASEMFAHFTR